MSVYFFLLSLINKYPHFKIALYMAFIFFSDTVLTSTVGSCSELSQKAKTKMILPKVIQTVFHFGDSEDIAHDYYLNASWVIELCQRLGERRVGDSIRRAVEAKRERCVKRYGEEWGKTAIVAALKRQRRKKTDDNASRPRK